MMPKKISLEINESIDYLEKEYSKAKGILKKDRIKTLIYVKKKRSLSTKVILEKNWVEQKKPFVVGYKITRS